MNGVEIYVTFPRFEVMNFMRAFLFVFICLPLLSIAQQNVLDGVYIREHVKTKEHISELKNEISTDHELKIDSSLTFKKAKKIEGFTNVNVQRFFAQWTNQLSVPLAPNNIRYQSDKVHLTGHCNESNVFLVYPNQAISTGAFYIKNAEVSNAEYRGFVQYVIDSIALTILAKEQPDQYYLNGKDGNLNYKMLKGLWLKVDNAEPLAHLYYGEEDDRFSKRKQLDPKNFNYRYTTSKGEQKTINIYPDTLSWVQDMSYSWMAPMTQMYFWHPVYDNYPVVGITYNQVQAYLQWLTKKGIKSLDKKGIAYEIALPTPEEIEYTTAVLYAQQTGKKNYNLYNLYLDRNYAFDLEVTRNPKILKSNWQDSAFSIYEKQHISNNFLNPYNIHNGSLYDDGGMRTLPPVDIDYLPGHYSINNTLYHLGTNVSEYLDATYQNYKDFTSIQSQTFKNSVYPSIRELGNNLANKINTYNNEDRLVMGANWMDEHHEVVFGAPLKSIYTKTFISPDSAYSTVGFRYVIRLKEDQIKPKPLQTRKVKTVDIFTALKKAGFELKVDSNNNNLKKMVFHNPAKEIEVKKPKPTGVINGIYIGYHDPSSFNHYHITQHHPKLQEAIKSNGGNLSSFYSTIPNQPSNLVVEYYIKAINEYTIELLQW